MSPGRSVPWLKEDFNYTIPGGLEPGEGSYVDSLTQRVQPVGWGECTARRWFFLL